MIDDKDIFWLDRGRDPTEPPNPAYPLGIDVDLSGGQSQTCKVALRYPAPRCGTYVIRCRRCGLRVTVTAAGRVDDPRSITLGCKPDA
jgi:hypothetical protein